MTNEEKGLVPVDDFKDEVTNAEITEYINPEDYVQGQPIFENNYNLQNLLPTAGTLKSTKEQQEILFAPPKDSDVDILSYNGVVYLSWKWYSDRLTRAFPLAWSIVPQGMPKLNGNTVLWGFTLIIEGIFMGFAVGEGKYVEKNKDMSYGDVMEACRSNALSRLCKGIGMGHELWDKDWVERWTKKNARLVNGKWAKRTIDPVIEAKNIWKNVAIEEGIMKDEKDTAGKEELKIVLLEVFTDINADNADEYLEEGIKRIREHKK